MQAKAKLESNKLERKSALKRIRGAEAPPCEKLTPEADLDRRAGQVERIKDTIEGLEDSALSYKITDPLPRTWQRVPVDLIGNLADVVTIEFVLYFGDQSFSGMPIYVSLKETMLMGDDCLAKALYDAHTVAAAMARISCLHNAGHAALLALSDTPSARLRAAPDPDEMMLHMTATGIDIGYHGAPDAKFTFQGACNSESLAAFIIKNAPKKARMTIELEVH